MNTYWNRIVHGLTPYAPGEQPNQPGLIKLSTNENPYPPSPRVLHALREQLDARLRLYPDPDARRLKQAISVVHGVKPEQVFVGNGSDEVMAHVFHALLKHELPVLFPDVTYGFYPVYCGLYGIAFTEVPLAPDFSLNLADCERPNGGVVFPNPNAPTGRALARSEIERFVQCNTDSVVVVDEAYADFGTESVAPLVARYPNLLSVHTLSKSRSLAGLRVGYALGDAGLIDGLERVKNSFNSYPLDRLAQAGAAAALEDVDHFERTRRAVMESREWLARALGALGFQVVPSSANFLLAHHPRCDAQWLLSELRHRNILVRHFRRPRIEQHLRISIGTREECERLVAALAELTDISRLPTAATIHP